MKTNYITILVEGFINLLQSNILILSDVRPWDQMN